MAFNQLLWSLHGKVIKKIVEDKPCIDLNILAPYDVYPRSTMLFLEKIERIVKEYADLHEFIDLTTGQCNPNSFKGKSCGLYLEAFCNGISDVLLNLNHILFALEESFLSESSFSILDMLQKLDYIADVLPSLNYALNQVRSGKFSGCTILDLCEHLINLGPDAVENVFRKIQEHCLKQFYKQTKLWLVQAVVFDPYSEFFISSANETSSSVDTSAISLVGTAISGPSTPGFRVNPQNLPNKIPLSVAIKMVFIGEALTICQANEIESESNERILLLCGISEQRIISRFTEIERKENFRLQDFSCLIDDLWIGVNKYIRQVSDEVGNINEQLTLMWEVYLLGRGELFQEFLLKGSKILNSNVAQIDNRNLNKLFKDAVYYVYLSDSSALTDQFYFKLPSKKALKPGSVWSCMQLKCKIKWPLHYLLTPEVMESYDRLFRFLLRLKKAQIDATAWKNISSIKNHSLRMELIEVRMFLLSVVGNLQNYCFTNVIAPEMTILLDSIKAASMFTDLQKSLSLFLTNIGNRLFLSDVGLMSSMNSTLTKSLSSIDTVHKCFKNIFALCNSFAELDGKEINSVINELTNIKNKLKSILKTLFSLLQKIDHSHFFDSENSSAHFYSLMMCLDYNNFFRNKFHLSPID